MAQNEKPLNFPKLLSDMTLTAVAVSIVAITFFSVSGLTPKPADRLASNDSAVLGVNSRQRALNYFPADSNRIPYIKDYSLSGNTGIESNAKITITFNPLEATTYEFTVVTIKNTSLDFKKIQLSPAYSLEGSFTTVSLIYAGQTSEIISANGMVTPLDLSIPPSAATDIAIRMQPTVKLATPVTLTLDFTEVP